MPASRVIHLASQICAGLYEAHRQGLVHRDIKPANLMAVEREGDPDFVKILDFGLLKVIGVPPTSSMRELTEEAIIKLETDSEELRTTTTLAGAVLGTPAHMAPEQIPGGGDDDEDEEEGDEPDSRTDIYAIGSVMYYLLTGTPPFNIRSEFALYHRKLTSEPTTPSRRAPDLAIPADLEAVVVRCLRRDPAERFASVELLKEAMACCDDARSWDRGAARAFWEEFPSSGARVKDISPPEGSGPPTRTLPLPRDRD